MCLHPLNFLLVQEDLWKRTTVRDMGINGHRTMGASKCLALGQQATCGSSVQGHWRIAPANTVVHIQCSIFHTICSQSIEIAGKIQRDLVWFNGERT
jgi:hypothetical protein